MTFRTKVIVYGTLVYQDAAKIISFYLLKKLVQPEPLIAVKVMLKNVAISPIIAVRSLISTS
jgi:hypothetical protein